ncbi:hypothetical protein NXW16_00735 [Bacteroides thetaiotaomicron]|nr:hypothetical protein [Bacteroides thetaiotaomicron]
MSTLLGIYNLVYAAYNEDGFPKHLHEQYMWQIILPPLKSGIYTVAQGSKRTAPSVVALQWI